jgi:hypothetical protein
MQKGGVFISVKQNNDPILATFDATLSPHGRINAPNLLLAFTHICYSIHRDESLQPTTALQMPSVGVSALTRN